ncbi:MFS transporter [Actinomadura darangshiensis]|uniref:MFS transporter n=1 Tax=Actinomadura darangshiensis TaxID=705336 RepID=UPI0014083185|nr:MFS transporter [Actinomadura darangshiensis]
MTGRVGRDGISAGLVRLLAVAVAVTVANLYYAQPLLDSLAADFGASQSSIGWAVTAAQAGYALGLVFLVPLRDIVRPRPLLVALTGVNAAALGTGAAAPTLAVFAVAAAVAGLASVTVTMLMAHAATLAGDDQRAGVIGTLLGGLLLGVLLARGFAGVLAGLLDWRAVYVVGAVLMTATAMILHRRLPASPRELSLSYPAQLRGVLHTTRAQPVLRWRAVNGGCAFGAFGCFWTTVTFLLAGHYQLTQLQIGAFALLGAAGAAGAVLAGRALGTRPRRQRWPVTAAISVLLVASFVPIHIGGTKLGWLVAGVLLMDAALQALNAANQAVIYDLLPHARARVSTVYATAMFVGGAVGSALGAHAYQRHGWAGVTVTAGAFALAGLGAHCAGRRHEQTRLPDRPRDDRRSRTRA